MKRTEFIKLLFVSPLVALRALFGIGKKGTPSGESEPMAFITEYGLYNSDESCYITKLKIEINPPVLVRKDDTLTIIFDKPEIFYAGEKLDGVKLASFTAFARKTDKEIMFDL